MAARGAASVKKMWIFEANMLSCKRAATHLMPAPAQRDIRILADPAAITRRAADEFVKAASEAVAKNGVFNVAFAGGSTPKSLYGTARRRSRLSCPNHLGQSARFLR